MEIIAQVAVIVVSSFEIGSLIMSAMLFAVMMASVIGHLIE